MMHFCYSQSRRDITLSELVCEGWGELLQQHAAYTQGYIGLPGQWRI